MSMPKMIFELEKFPYALAVKEKVESIREYIELLTKRKTLIKEGFSEKSEFEKNEIEITIHETNVKLANRHKVLNEQEQYFKDYCSSLSKKIDEVNEKYDKMIMRARGYKQKKEVVAKLNEAFAIVKDMDLENNWEQRIKHYIDLDMILNAKKTPAK